MSNKIEKSKYMVLKYGVFTPDVIDDIISALASMYIYDNSEAYETREDELKWWKSVKKHAIKALNQSE